MSGAIYWLILQILVNICTKQFPFINVSSHQTPNNDTSRAISTVSRTFRIMYRRKGILGI